MKLFILALSSALLTTPSIAQVAQCYFDPCGNLQAEAVENSMLPLIVGQPYRQVVAPGKSASFSVVASDTRNVSYQWRFNGTDRPGATADSLFVTNVTAGDEGLYSVLLANSSGSVTSAPAMLFIDADRDGLPDSWEQSFFGNLNQYPTGDFDGDGISNLDEFNDGTNPTNAASVSFRLVVQKDGGAINVNPSKLTYTNGEIVTLTASAILPVDFFRGWTGDTNSTNATISLAMTTNRTVFAHLGFYDITWTNAASGNWDVGANWSPNFIPTTNDTIAIGGSITVTLNRDNDCAALTLGTSGSPTLSGTGTLTLHHDSSWSRGTMSGTGRTVISPGATLAINNSANLVLNTRTLDNAGTVLWTGTDIYFSNGVLTNRPGSLFLVQSSGAMQLNSGNNRLDNAGTFRKTSSGTTIFVSNVALNNYGNVDIQAGTLFLDGGGLNNSNIIVAAGATLDLSGGTYTGSAGSSITGLGNFRESGAVTTLNGLLNLSGTHTFVSGTANLNGTCFCTNNTLSISGGTANFNGVGIVAPTNLLLSSGSLGGTNLVTILGQGTWSGGSMIGAGRTVIPSGVTLTVNNSPTVGLTSRTLDNAGTVLWSGADISFSNGVITNRPGALFQVQGAGSVRLNSGVNRVDNAGTFRKTSSGTTTFEGNIALNNYDTVEIQAGTLFLDGGGLNNSNIIVAAGATLDLSGGTYTGSVSSSITGPGSFRESGAVTTLNGLLNLSGTHTFVSGTANLNGTCFCTNNTLSISGGTANFNGTGLVAPTNITLSGGSLGGTSLVTALGQMTWSGGSMIGAGRTFVPSGVTLTINNSAAIGLTTRTLENAGTALWSGTDISFSNGVITNRAGALFQVQGAGSLRLNSGLNRIENAGTFRKTSSGTTTFESNIALNNYGTVDTQAGTLFLDGGGLNSSAITVATGATLDLSGGTYTDTAAASITGGGNLRESGAVTTLAGLVNLAGTNSFVSGTANLNGNYICTNNLLLISGGNVNVDSTGTVSPNTFNLSGGNLGGSGLITVLSQMTWSGGNHSGTGRTTIARGAILNLTTVGSVNMTSRTLDNAGTVIWSGSGTIFFSNAVVTNRPGALFQMQGSGTFQTGGGSSRVDNAGTFRKTSSGTTTLLSPVKFNNYGTLDLRNGILAAGGGYSTITTNATLAVVIGGTTLGSGYSQLNALGTVSLSGTLDVTFTNAFVPSLSNTFTVLTMGTRSGTFSSFSYPSNLVTLQLSNSPTAVILTVTGVTAPFSMLPPRVLGTNVELSWTSVSNVAYRVEFNGPSLDPSNWNALPGDITATNSTASKTDPLTADRRFYRVRRLP
jgi:hypothetical protein